MTTRDVSAATAAAAAAAGAAAAAAPHPPPTRTLTLIPTPTVTPALVFTNNLATIVTLMCFNPLRPPHQDTRNIYGTSIY